jgi:hypothetical protein
MGAWAFTGGKCPVIIQHLFAPSKILGETPLSEGRCHQKRARLSRADVPHPYRLVIARRDDAGSIVLTGIPRQKKTWSSLPIVTGRFQGFRI